MPTLTTRAAQPHQELFVHVDYDSSPAQHSHALDARQRSRAARADYPQRVLADGRGEELHAPSTSTQKEDTWLVLAARRSPRSWLRSRSAARRARARSTAAPRRTTSTTLKVTNAGGRFSSHRLGLQPHPALPRASRREQLQDGSSYYYTLDGDEAYSDQGEQNQRLHHDPEDDQPDPPVQPRHHYRFPARTADRRPTARLIERDRHPALDHRRRGAGSGSEFPRRSLRRRFRARPTRSGASSPSPMWCGRCRPAATSLPRDVEDMYRPDRFGRTETGAIEESAGSDVAMKLAAHPGTVGAAVAAAARRRGWVRSLRAAAARRDPRAIHTGARSQRRMLATFRQPTGAWRLPVKPPKSIRAYLRCCSPGRISASASIRASIRSRCCARPIRWRRRRASSPAPRRSRCRSARLLEPRERTLGAKLADGARVQLEWHLSKDEILELYLTLAPYGGNLEGVRAATLAWFGKEPKRLTIGEAGAARRAAAVAGGRRPDRHPGRAARARPRARPPNAARIPAERDRAGDAGADPRARRPFPALAPQLRDQASPRHRRRTSSPRRSTRRCRRSSRTWPRERARLSTTTPTSPSSWSRMRRARCWRAIAWRANFGATRGQVDLSAAPRSPGSTLKPFIYGIAFEDGIVHPQTLIDDKPTAFGDYEPRNFDRDFQGTVTVASALQQSLNVPAVALLDRIGARRLNARVAQRRRAIVLPKGTAPGSPWRSAAWASLSRPHHALCRAGARRHRRAADRAYHRRTRSPPRRLLDPVAAWTVFDVLLGSPPPENAAGGRIAFKTGTSYGYRDAWSMGFDGRHTIGIWVGRPDGAR